MTWTIREVSACTLVIMVLMLQAAVVCFATLVTFICLRPFSKELYQNQLPHILSSWSQNLIGFIHWLSPSQMIFYFDKSCPPSTHIVNNSNATLHHHQHQNHHHHQQRQQQSQQKGHYYSPTCELNLPDRTIVISNHQIYADWIYVWFVAYLAKAHGSLKIVLKNELKYLPFFGLGMQLFDFIFMKRRLANDRDTIIQNLERSKANGKPMWLILFPEGTVISKEMRSRSQAYAVKNGINDNLYTLLPRSTGLKLCTATLGDTVEWVYDLTIGYSGIQAGQIPEDTLRLKHIFTGCGPSEIHVHIRRYHVSELALDEDDAFSKWMMDRWVEKDKRMEQFYEEGRFVSFNHDDNDGVSGHGGTGDCSSPLLGGGHTYTVPIRLGHPLKESLDLWLYMIPYIIALYLFYSLVSYVLALYNHHY